MQCDDNIVTCVWQCRQYSLTFMRFSLLKLVKFSFLFFLLFATGFITPVNKDYHNVQSFAYGGNWPFGYATLILIVPRVVINVQHRNSLLLQYWLSAIYVISGASSSSLSRILHRSTWLWDNWPSCPKIGQMLTGLLLLFFNVGLQSAVVCNNITSGQSNLT